MMSRDSFRPFDVLLWDHDEDREAFGDPLALALKERGARILQRVLGADFAEQKESADYIVPVLSRSFFAGDWPATDLDRMLLQGSKEHGRVVPVWYQISREDVLAASGALEDKLAFDHSFLDINSIAQGIVNIVRPDLNTGILHKAAWQALLEHTTLGDALRHPPVLRARLHDPLPNDLVVRARMIRAALLPCSCFRWPMEDWMEGLRQDLEPYQAVREWETLAQAYHELSALGQHMRVCANEERSAAATSIGNSLCDLPEGGHATILSGLDELGALDPNRMFLLVWSVSQSSNLESQDFGFSAGLQAIAQDHLCRDAPVVDVEERLMDTENLTFNVEGRMASGSFVDLYDDLGLGDGALQLTQPRPWSKQYDVFISHASEDKERLVRPLAEQLQAQGAKVWYDEFTLRAGLSLSASIESGIGDAEFGIVVLSPNFIRKHWPQRELKLLKERATTDSGRLMLFWHDLSPNEAPEFDTALLGIDRLESRDLSVPQMAENVLKRIRPELAQVIQGRLQYQNALEAETVRAATPQTLWSAPRRHARLNDDLIRRVRLLRAVLFGGYPRSMDFWVDGFLRDTNPEAEIAEWERRAAMLQEATFAIRTIEAHDKRGLRGFFWKRRTVSEREIFSVLTRLIDFPNAPETTRLLPKYPEKITDIISAIVASESAIEIL